MSPPTPKRVYSLNQLGDYLQPLIGEKLFSCNARHAIYYGYLLPSGYSPWCTAFDIPLNRWINHFAPPGDGDVRRDLSLIGVTLAERMGLTFISIYVDSQLDKRGTVW